MLFHWSLIKNSKNSSDFHQLCNSDRGAQLKTILDSSTLRFYFILIRSLTIQGYLQCIQEFIYSMSGRLFFFFFFLVFLGPHPRHMEVPRLGVKWGLKPLAYTTATAMRIWTKSATYSTAHGNVRSLTHGVRPRMEPTSHTSWVCFCWATMGTPLSILLSPEIFSFQNLK